MGLECKRDLFRLPGDLHYLNCAYMSPLSREVEEAGIRGIRKKRVPSRICPEDFFEESDEARRRFARIIGAPDPRRVAIIPAASYGISVAAANAPLGAGGNVVIVDEQFPGNVYAWRSLARRRGAELRIVGPDGPVEGEGSGGGGAPAAASGGGGPGRGDAGGRGARWNARILEAIDGETAVVSLGHVHWTDGTRFDLAAIGARAREVDAALVVDGTQSVGAFPFDVEELRPDALVCAAYKWLLGPYSVGLAYYGPRYDEGEPLEETWIAREGSEDFARLVDYRDEYKPGAVRYDVGERSNFILLPMLVRALGHLGEWTVEGIGDYCRRLTGRLVELARPLGFTVEDEAWRAPHILGLRAPEGIDAAALQEEMEARRISVSVRGSAVRVSPHLYNDEADIEALAGALREAVG